nr:reverse transcriptase domain-containing protein [Tanacetum cinerariifolium]
MELVFHISDCAVENQVKFAAYTMLDAALTWWNGHVRTLGHNDAYAMTWKTFKKRLTDKYCPKSKIKKLEIELWNLKVKGNDVGGYTQRFQELALMCTKFLSDETEKVDKGDFIEPTNVIVRIVFFESKELLRSHHIDETMLELELLNKNRKDYDCFCTPFGGYTEHFNHSMIISHRSYGSLPFKARMGSSPDYNQQPSNSFEWCKTISGMVTSMRIRHTKPYTLRGGPSMKLEQRLDSQTDVFHLH